MFRKLWNRGKNIQQTVHQKWFLPESRLLFIQNIPHFKKSPCKYAPEHKIEKYFLANLRSDGNLLFAPKFKWYFIGLHFKTCASFYLFFAHDGWAGAYNHEPHPNSTSSHSSVTDQQMDRQMDRQSLLCNIHIGN